MNIGPTHDGRITPIFEERLRQVGKLTLPHFYNVVCVICIQAAGWMSMERPSTSHGRGNIKTIPSIPSFGTYVLRTDEITILFSPALYNLVGP